MIRTLHLTSCLVAAVLTATLAPDLGAGQPQADDQAKLRVGVTPTMPPMIFKQAGKLAGVEADLAQAVARELGRPVTFVELPWEELINSLEAGKIDIVMSSMSITPARQTRVTFSTPYLRVGQMALVRADSQFRSVPLGLSLPNQTLGLKKATTGDLLVQQEFPKAKRKYFASGDDAAKALAKKKIDAFISDSPMIWYLAGKYEAQSLVAVQVVYTDETLAWAMRRSDPELVASVNKAAKAIADSGELRRILSRWIPKLE